MFGVGQEWVHTRQYGVTTNSVAAEAVLDFMFWPSGKHKFGWFLEPGYEYNFGRGHERSIGISGGLLIDPMRCAFRSELFQVSSQGVNQVLGRLGLLIGRCGLWIKNVKADVSDYLGHESVHSTTAY